MLRHTALFLWRDFTTEEQKKLALHGLAYLSYGCPSVRAVDFGVDLHGGSNRLREIKPTRRTPLWDARSEGPPSVSFDMALNLDFESQEELDEYNDDHVHEEVAQYNAAICENERTARVDWWYDGPPRIDRGGVRHTALFLWRDDVTDSQMEDVRKAFAGLNGAVSSLNSIEVADNVGTLPTDYDLIVDATFADAEGAKEFLAHDAYKEANELVSEASKYEWTARITHTMNLG